MPPHQAIQNPFSLHRVRQAIGRTRWSARYPTQKAAEHTGDRLVESISHGHERREAGDCHEQGDERPLNKLRASLVKAESAKARHAQGTSKPRGPQPLQCLAQCLLHGQSRPCKPHPAGACPTFLGLHGSTQSVACREMGPSCQSRPEANLCHDQAFSLGLWPMAPRARTARLPDACKVCHESRYRFVSALHRLLVGWRTSPGSR